MKVVYEALKCKYCGSNHVVRYGKYKTSQKWLCRECSRYFTDNSALPHMKMPANQVAEAIDLYYRGVSLNGISEHFAQVYHDNPSNAAIYSWIERFSNEGVKESEKYKLSGDTEWLGDETVVTVNGKKLWVIDILGSDSRVLLASYLSKNRTIRDIKIALEQAHKRSGTIPKRIITDGWKAYPDAVEQVFGADSIHVESTPFTSADLSTNKVERAQGSLKDRYKVMRGLKQKERAQQFLDGYRFYYNFLRIHDSLGKTPAQQANVKYPFRNWAEVIQMSLPKAYPKISREVVVSEIPNRGHFPIITKHMPRISPKMPRISERRGSLGK